jgi:hypothetical protein
MAHDHRNKLVPSTALSDRNKKIAESTAAAVKALNSDCLQEIFLHLPLRGLLVAARGESKALVLAFSFLLLSFVLISWLKKVI